MNVYGSKNKVTLRRSGQRRDVLECFNLNVMTFGPTSRCYREAWFSRSRRWNPKSRRCREVCFQRRDVRIQRRDVPERYIFNVATLSPTPRRSQDQHPGNFYNFFLRIEKLYAFRYTPP